jgi:hypothetical protein
VRVFAAARVDTDVAYSKATSNADNKSPTHILTAPEEEENKCSKIPA